MEKTRIGIVGVGTVGGAYRDYFLAQGYERGHTLFCYDKDPQKKCADDLSRAQICLICVPTPSRADGACDTRMVEEAVSMAACPERGIVIVSTVPPGTTERLQRTYPDSIFCRVPEFLREASAREDCAHPERQIIGFTKKGRALAEQLTQILPRAPVSSPGLAADGRLFAVNATEAEIIKYANNLFGALKVSFANLIYDYAAAIEQKLEREGVEHRIDSDTILELIGEDKRIGRAWMKVKHCGYRGFGGPCFPKDFRALVASMEEAITKTYGSGVPISAHTQTAINTLKTIYHYNETLLADQGLTVEEVSAPHFKKQ
ncbi:MAG: UDP-glucose/GDP-mannose dehydrogenase family protein [Parcubacteria group bacterium]|nr:UDP-glucose/GDP-mannose dehydrogenase family protein [Parcubacteria group bacterium]